ncbi:VOC family protein [Salinicoccus hispanicus]|uniref:VOC family protein n=1 Tax=Salinicoccus hispanicus TaxID=157225 RepID=A0A6N8U0T3_9STAP|nr:VOC family protein [Salinicoccus hispanicus]MXQ51363.1 VOC family protein [Salinicoccus hispanicus]
MFTKLAEVMLYVDDQDASKKFWTEKLGFKVINASEAGDEMRWVELKPKEGTETSIILFDRKTVEKFSPELNFGTPSLMFFTDDLDQLHQELADKDVNVGKIEVYGSMRTFNFSDEEENYFAVMKG